jgi:hypothetical protein
LCRSGQLGSDYSTALTCRNLVLPAWYIRRHSGPASSSKQPKPALKNLHTGASAAVRLPDVPEKSSVFRR